LNAVARTPNFSAAAFNGKSKCKLNDSKRLACARRELFEDKICG